MLIRWPNVLFMDIPWEVPQDLHGMFVKRHVAIAMGRPVDIMGYRMDITNRPAGHHPQGEGGASLCPSFYYLTKMERSFMVLGCPGSE